MDRGPWGGGYRTLSTMPVEFRDSWTGLAVKEWQRKFSKLLERTIVETPRRSATRASTENFTRSRCASANRESTLK